MEDYKPNSYLSKTAIKPVSSQEHKIEKVVSGTVQKKEPSGFKKFKESFIQEDGGTIKNYIIGDVVIPMVKQAILQSVGNSLSMLLYGEAGHFSAPKFVGGGTSTTPYHRLYSQSQQANNVVKPASSGFDYSQWILETREEADAVASSLLGYLNDYGTVTINDFYEMLGVTEPGYTGQRYGWTDLRTLQVVRVPEGYCVKLPKPIDLGR